MAVKVILLHVAGDTRFSARLALALTLAKSHGATVRALAPLPPVVLPVADGGFVPADLIQRIAEDQANAAKRQLDQAAREAGAAGVTCTGEAVEGDVVSILTAASAVADLLIVGQPGGDGAGGLDLALAGDIVTSSACPVLCVPYAGQFAATGGNVLVAWNGGKEAARAMRAALPLLAGAKKATVLAIGDAPGGRADAAAAADYLKRHGVAADSRTIPPGDIDPGSILLGLVTDMAIDLIVMGAYGHSRAREFVFGGVTRSLLQQMTAPVLFAH